MQNKLRKSWRRRHRDFYSGSVQLDLHPLSQAPLGISIKKSPLTLSTDDSRTATLLLFGFKSKPDPFHGLGSNRYNILEILNHTLKLSKKSRCTNLNSQYSILTIQWKYLSRIRWKERNLKAWRESNNGDLFQFLRIVKL